MSPPPQYVLVSHSNAVANAAPTLTHPTIQYQFRDDPPLSLPDSQHVLVMDYDPAAPDDVRVQSLSHQLAVTAVRVTDAPGADGAANTQMYVLETAAHQ